MIGQFRWTSSRTHLLGWNVDKNQNTNFVWSCQSHTFTHCWDGISNGSTFVSTHCWPNNVCQFDPSLTAAKIFPPSLSMAHRNPPCEFMWQVYWARKEFLYPITDFISEWFSGSFLGPISRKPRLPEVTLIPLTSEHGSRPKRILVHNLLPRQFSWVITSAHCHRLGFWQSFLNYAKMLSVQHTLTIIQKSSIKILTGKSNNKRKSKYREEISILSCRHFVKQMIVRHEKQLQSGL